MKAPLRLLEDPALAPSLRAELEKVRAAVDPYDAVQGLEKLESALALGATPRLEEGASVAPPASGSAGGVLGGAGAAKLGLAALAAAAIAVGVVAWPDGDAGQRAAHVPVPSSPPPVAEVMPQPPPVPAAPAPMLDAPPAPIARAPRDPDGALRRETAQVGRIKRWLERAPARAYALAQAGHREFPAGMLREEREALAVLALWNMGRDVEAARRARAFLARYPDSPLRGQMEQRLAPEGRHGESTP
jgi:hypothetical protein